MKNIFKSIADFQQAVPVIFKDSQAYGYKYADLPAILEVINPLLKEYGLGFTQIINGTTLQTIVFHVESGEQIESNIDIPQGVSLKGMNEFQVLGSAITYLRRYALSSMLGLVTDKDIDAQGEQVKPESKAAPVKEFMNQSHVRYSEFIATLGKGGKTKTGERLTAQMICSVYEVSPEAKKALEEAENEFLNKTK